MGCYRLAIMAFCLLLTACPRPLMPPLMPDPPKGGPPEFQEGWKDGCETGLAQHGSSPYRTSFSFYQNPNLVMNPIYYKAWKDSENYCRTYIFEYAFRSFDVFCTVDGLSNDCEPGPSATEGMSSTGIPMPGGGLELPGSEGLGSSNGIPMPW